MPLSSQVEISASCKRLGIAIVHDVKVRHDAKHALLFLAFNLLSRDFDRIVSNLHLGVLCRKSKLGVQDFDLVGIEGDSSGRPLLQTLRNDREAVGGSR